MKYGWCYTRDDYFDPGKVNPKHGGWGFCSKNCFLNKRTAKNGVLRIVDHANVLKQEICNELLKKSLPTWGVSYKPKILCAGIVHHWSTDVWRMRGDKFTK